MSGIGKTIIKKVGDREIICRELTVSSIRGMLSHAMTSDIVNEALFDDIRLSDLVFMTNLEKEEIEEILPSELRLIVDGCKEANPDFFGMLARVANRHRTS
ncbi:hypothetical protein [Pseudomonas indica]|uniref:hypothetical protein n=1 Tax=Pseudomonas indica TaxID=137658 RepID=UPI003FD3B4FC